MRALGPRVVCFLLTALGLLAASCSSAVDLTASDDDAGVPASTEPTTAETTVAATATTTSGDAVADSTESTVTSTTTSTTEAQTTTTAAETTTTTVARVPVVEPEVVARLPHDGTAFTQGLELSGGVLLESLGLEGVSARRRVAPGTGEVSTSAPLSADQFGAGLTVVGETLVQLTLTSGTAIVADLTTLQPITTYSFDGQGWGLCNDGERFVMSDGSDTLTFRSLDSFAVLGEVAVTLDGAPLDRLNELECVDGRVLANVWLTSDIVLIDPTTGEVQVRVDASSLVPTDLGPDDVLNGIAHNPDSDTYYVTGKRWTVLYEVRLPTG